MFRRLIVCAVVPALFIFGCSSPPSPEAASTDGIAETAAEILDEVVSAMMADGVYSVTYSGRAWRIRNGWMQTPHADAPWPFRDEITNYRRAIDLRQPASQGRGDTFAQNLFLAPATAGTYSQSIEANDSDWADRLEIYLTPWGFLKGAADNGVELSPGKLDGVEYRVLTWMTSDDQVSPSGLHYTVKGYINDDNLIAGVETWVEDPFMGDFHVVQVYRDYRELNGLMVPQTIEQQRGGGGVFGVIITDASANPQNLSELLVAPQQRNGAAGGGGGGNGPADIVQQVGERVWLITGGYVALVAEFSDHVLVFEAGQNEARGEQILAAVTALIPDKPIRYLVNSHAHSDHTGGIVPFIRNGTTLVTHTNNARFLEMALSTPRTLLGEETLNPRIEAVDGVAVFQDSTNRVELHSVPNGHSDGMLVAILPRQRILFQADFTLPQPGQEPNPFVVTLAQYVAEVDPDFEQYLAVHAAQVPQTKADLLATIGL
jgi:glyoxylase-like metal-dependent hydrolase (beta-lactamase superfamily II)